MVAPGIAEALFATALGLIAAIPALIAYNKLSGSIDSYANRLSSFSEEFAVVLSRELDSGQGGLSHGRHASSRHGGDAAAAAAGASAATMVEINMTPLVDVMLVLLIVFMITAPLLTAGVAVDLPQARQRAAAGPGRAAERHRSTPTGEVYLQDSAIDAGPARPAAAGDHRPQARRADLRARRPGRSTTAR